MFSISVHVGLRTVILSCSACPRSPGESREILTADSITILLQGRDITTSCQILSTVICKFMKLKLDRSKIPAYLCRVLRYRRARHIYQCYKIFVDLTRYVSNSGAIQENNNTTEPHSYTSKDPGNNVSMNHYTNGFQNWGGRLTMTTDISDQKRLPRQVAR